MIVFLSGPYNGNIDTNIANARKIAIELWEKGYTVICPHLNSAHFEKDCCAGEEAFLGGYRDILRRCDAVVLIPSWEHSSGSRVELSEALDHGIPIYAYPNLPKKDY